MKYTSIIRLTIFCYKIRGDLRFTFNDVFLIYCIFASLFRHIFGYYLCYCYYYYYYCFGTILRNTLFMCKICLEGYILHFYIFCNYWWSRCWNTKYLIFDKCHDINSYDILLVKTEVKLIHLFLIEMINDYHYVFYVNRIH